MEPYFIDSVMIAMYCVTLMSCIALRHHSKDISVTELHCDIEKHINCLCLIIYWLYCWIKFLDLQLLRCNN